MEERESDDVAKRIEDSFKGSVFGSSDAASAAAGFRQHRDAGGRCSAQPSTARRTKASCSASVRRTHLFFDFWEKRLG